MQCAGKYKQDAESITHRSQKGEGRLRGKVKEDKRESRNSLRKIMKIGGREEEGEGRLGSTGKRETEGKPELDLRREGRKVVWREEREGRVWMMVEGDRNKNLTVRGRRLYGERGLPNIK